MKVIEVSNQLSNKKPRRVLGGLPRPAGQREGVKGFAADRHAAPLHATPLARKSGSPDLCEYYDAARASPGRAGDGADRARRLAGAMLSTALWRASRISAFVTIAALMSGCSSLERLRLLGDQPPLTAINNPTAAPGYKPVQMPMPAPQPAVYQPNSLWRTGSRAFFKDQRAHQIGDILTIIVNINDQANWQNETQRSRQNNEDSGITNFFGKPKVPIMNTPVPTRIFTADSNASSDGKGSIARQEAVLTNVAAVVTQVLPNGNLVVEGKQEVRVNFEIRELVVAGIVRPEDIQSDNTIDSSKIAEARIAYGGRGQIMDVQQPRYGQQVLDVLLPF
jgi:flagellar L-ring protein FlgH